MWLCVFVCYICVYLIGICAYIFINKCYASTSFNVALLCIMLLHTSFSVWMHLKPNINSALLISPTN